MPEHIPRPKLHLTETTRRFPLAWRHLDQFRAGRGDPLPRWPDWCFVPLAGAYAIVTQGKWDPHPLPDDGADVAIVGALGAWRVTQGIYLFDPDVAAAVWETPVEGDIPVQILYRLPEWCVYVDTPGRMVLDRRLYGFFAHLEWDANTGREELRLLLDTSDGMLPYPIHLVRGGLVESIQAMLAESDRQARLLGYEVRPTARDQKHLAQELAPPISLLLYLCSRSAEYRDARGEEAQPRCPRPTKTRHGERFFPPDQPRIWETGWRMGAALRSARTASASDDDLSGRTSPRAHIRRAHWHAYWHGPKKAFDKEKRRLEMHWLPPIPVNVETTADLVPTVREVE